jgi:hypothetical protein
VEGGKGGNNKFIIIQGVERGIGDGWMDIISMRIAVQLGLSCCRKGVH